MLDGEIVRVLFVEEKSRSIFSTHHQLGWQPSPLQVDGFLGSWIRGNVYTRPDGMKVYGYIYDAGSDGGAGMNRFAVRCSARYALGTKPWARPIRCRAISSS